MEDLIASVYYHHQIKIQSFDVVRGGDICDSYRISTSDGVYFLKTNTSDSASDMFNQETISLRALKGKTHIKVPSVIGTASSDGIAWLILEYLEAKNTITATPKSYEILGENLAQLHSISHDNFGWDNDNYIGLLPQINTPHQDWATFYFSNRILNQLQLAIDLGHLSFNNIPSEDRIENKLRQILGDVSSSLLHGDFWNGNHMILSNGQPAIFDPASYLGDRLVDIAMSKLFGGFPDRFYDSYFSTITRPIHFHERISIYQLYYLLVHLNIFGLSYQKDVIRIIKRYLS